MKRILFAAVVITVIATSLRAQISITTDASSPDASAMLDVKSTTKGFLPPRMTQSDRLLITSPATGLTVYQTDGSAGLYTYNGSSWTWVGGSNFTGSGSSGQAAFWTGTGSFSGSNNFFWDNGNSRLGIGTNNPQFPLHILGNSNVTQLAVQACSTQTNYYPLLILRNSSGTRLLDLHSDDYRNVFLGYAAGQANAPGSTNGQYNTFLGSMAGFTNSTGYMHTFTGYQSGYNNSTGNYNTGFGMQSLYTNSTGSFNTAIGNSALNSATDSKNTAVGYASGSMVSTGIENVLIGSNADVGSSDYSNTVAVGYNTKTTASNQVRLGNSSIATLFCQGAFGSTSSSSPNMVVNSSGQIMRSTASVPAGTGNPGQVAYWSDASTLTSSSSLFWDNTNARLRTGSLGLLESGTTPQYFSILQAGDQSADLTLSLPVNAGFPGQVLSTNGSGTLSWLTPESILTFTNGLTRSSNTVKLGGSLTENTTLTQSGTQALTFTNSGTSGTIFNLTSTGDFQVQDNGTAFLTATDEGRIGIGTASPGQKLTVDGTLGILEGGSSPANHTIFQGGTQTADITYTLPVDDGTSGQFLTTDGSGTLSWGNVSAPLSFSNGLTLSSGTVKLGGALTENTAITQDGTETLTFTNNGSANTIVNLSASGDFEIQDFGSAFFTATDAGRIGIGTATPNEQLEITGNLRLPSTTSNTGIFYFGGSPFAHKYGTGNTFVGQTSGNFTLTGTSNAAFGTNALGALTDGVYNTAIGNSSLTVNTGGDYNTAVGTKSLEKNTGGNNNIAIGASALNNNLTGSDNVAIGLNALSTITTGTGNIGIGSSASTAAAGTNNIVVGNGSSIATGNSSSIVIGAGSTNTGSNSIGIGSSVGITTDNTIKLGDGSITSLYCWGPYSSTTTEMPNLYISGTNGQIMRSTATVGDLTHSGTCTGTRVAFWAGSTSSRSLTSSANLFWDNTNFRLGIGTITPSQHLDVNGNIAFSNTGIIFSGTERLLFSPGTANTFLGRYSGNTTLTGSYNTGLGEQALYSLTSGTNNTGAGDNALFTNATGLHNTAVGSGSLYYNTNSWNTAIGSGSLSENSSGHANTAVGYCALTHNTTAIHNTCVGYTALTQITTGSYNTALGYNAGPSDYAAYNTTALGCDAAPWQNNQVVIGNEYVGWIGGQVTWSTYSDGRFKKDQKADIPGLSFIMKLKPVSYTWDIRGLESFLHKRSVSKEGMDADKKGTGEQERIRYSGFIAQEVEEAANSIRYDFSGVCPAKDQNEIYSLRYSEFVVPLVKAVQEQQATISTLQSQVETLKKEREQILKNQETLLSRLEALERQRQDLTKR